MVVKSEAAILAECRLEASRLGAIVWRNNSGAYKDARGNYIKYGVCNPGGADLIGIYKGRFLAIECKSSTGRATEAQLNFIRVVNDLGGIAGVCRCKEDVKLLLDNSSNRTIL